MSYQVLARKWRPRNFKDMVGQEHVLKALINALDQDRLHHAYLFTGTRGVGKTTLARILAKCLNCEQGVSSEPCGQCESCINIDEGRFIDLIEVDAASRAKVDETRELMDNVQYAPTVGRYKVYLIDEVHMFSNHSFNALLKTLEEPPPHVKFLLATTEAKKVPVTILSRCLQFNLKHLSPSQIETQLKRILQDEGIEFDDASCQSIARAANGSVRDALSLLDQAIAYGGGQLQQDQVRSMLGTIDSAEVLSLLEHVFKGDAHSVLAAVELISQHNPDYDQIMTDILQVLQKIALIQVVEDSRDLLQGDVEQLQLLAGQVDREQVQLFYQIVLTGRRDLALAPDPRSGFEMSMIRMLVFSPDQQTESLTQQSNTVATGGPKPPPVAKAKEEKPAAPVKHASDNQQTSQVTRDWKEIIDEMALAGLVKELAGHCVLKEHSGDKVHLTLPPDKEHLLKLTQKDRLHDAIRTRFGEQTKLVITVEKTGIESPVQQRDRINDERQRAAVESITADPNIKAMQEVFDATVDENSIQSEQSN